MDFKYTINPYADVAIMMLDEHIGDPGDGSKFIDGNEFARELLMLDSMGKSKIEIRINSVGGSVMDGMSIYNAILLTKCQVDTNVIGIAASIAGVISQAGRNRIMSDYALVMMHPPSGGEDQQSLDKIQESLSTMLSRRANVTAEAISAIMTKTGWLSSTECQTLGLCDEVVMSGDLNKPRLKPQTDPFTAYNVAKKYYNSITIKTTITMDKITNKLELIKGSNEEAIVNAIDALEAKHVNVVNRITTEFEAEKEKAAALELENTELKAKVKLAEEADAATLEAKAVEDIENAVKLKKIVDVIEVKNTWIANYKKDPKGTKLLIDNMGITAKSPAINIVNDAPKTVGGYFREKVSNLTTKK